MARKKAKRGSSADEDEDFALLDPPLSEQEIERRRALGYQVRTHGGQGRTTAYARTAARVRELEEKVAPWRRQALRAAYDAHDAFLQRAASDRQFGLAPVDDDPRAWLIELERALLGRSPRGSVDGVTDLEAERRTAFLLGAFAAVSKLGREQVERVEARQAGGLASRGKLGWFARLLLQLSGSESSPPRPWIELRSWIEGAGPEDCKAAGIESVRVEERPNGEHVVADLPDGETTSVTRSTAMRAAARVRDGITSDSG